MGKDFSAESVLATTPCSDSARGNCFTLKECAIRLHRSKSFFTIRLVKCCPERWWMSLEIFEVRWGGALSTLICLKMLLLFCRKVGLDDWSLRAYGRRKSTKQLYSLPVLNTSSDNAFITRWFFQYYRNLYLKPKINVMSETPLSSDWVKSCASMLAF